MSNANDDVELDFSSSPEERGWDFSNFQKERTNPFLIDSKFGICKFRPKIKSGSLKEKPNAVNENAFLLRSFLSFWLAQEAEGKQVWTKYGYTVYGEVSEAKLPDRPGTGNDSTPPKVVDKEYIKALPMWSGALDFNLRLLFSKRNQAIINKFVAERTEEGVQVTDDKWNSLFEDMTGIQDVFAVFMLPIQPNQEAFDSVSLERLESITEEINQEIDEEEENIQEDADMDEDERKARHAYALAGALHMILMMWWKAGNTRQCFKSTIYHILETAQAPGTNKPWLLWDQYEEEGWTRFKNDPRLTPSFGTEQTWLENIPSRNLSDEDVGYHTPSQVVHMYHFMSPSMWNLSTGDMRFLNEEKQFFHSLNDVYQACKRSPPSCRIVHMPISDKAHPSLPWDNVEGESMVYPSQNMQLVTVRKISDMALKEMALFLHFVALNNTTQGQGSGSPSLFAEIHKAVQACMPKDKTVLSLQAMDTVLSNMNTLFRDKKRCSALQKACNEYSDQNKRREIPTPETIRKLRREFERLLGLQSTFRPDAIMQERYVPTPIPKSLVDGSDSLEQARKSLQVLSSFIHFSVFLTARVADRQEAPLPKDDVRTCFENTFLFLVKESFMKDCFSEDEKACVEKISDVLKSDSFPSHTKAIGAELQPLYDDVMPAVYVSPESTPVEGGEKGDQKGGQKRKTPPSGTASPRKRPSPANGVGVGEEKKKAKAKMREEEEQRQEADAKEEGAEEEEGAEGAEGAEEEEVDAEEEEADAEEEEEKRKKEEAERKKAEKERQRAERNKRSRGNGGKGLGNGGKGLGKGGAVRHRKVLRDNIQGITKPALRRLARRGGVKRISGLIYEETRGVMKTFLENVIRDAVTYTDHAQRKTVIAMDVVYALKRMGRTIYGFGG